MSDVGILDSEPVQRIDVTFLLIDLLAGEALDLKLYLPVAECLDYGYLRGRQRTPTLGTWRSHSFERPSLEPRVEEVKFDICERQCVASCIVAFVAVHNFSLGQMRDNGTR